MTRDGQDRGGPTWVTSPGFHHLAVLVDEAKDMHGHGIGVGDPVAADRLIGGGPRG